MSVTKLVPILPWTLCSSLPNHVQLFELHQLSHISMHLLWLFPLPGMLPLSVPCLFGGHFQDSGRCQLFCEPFLPGHSSMQQFPHCPAQDRTDCSFFGVSTVPKASFSTWDMLTFIVCVLLLMLSTVKNMLPSSLHLQHLAQCSIYGSNSVDTNRWIKRWMQFEWMKRHQLFKKLFQFFKFWPNAFRDGNGREKRVKSERML